MILKRIEDFTRGWLIGDFEPSLIRTKNFEIGILEHKKDEEWPRHVHQKAVEYNVVINGRMLIQTRNLDWTVLTEGDVFVIEKNESCLPKFLTDCKLLVIKVPSVVGDKIILEK